MFVEERTRPVLAEVCRLLHRPSDQAVLLRHHTNALYAVADIVVKIAPAGVSLERMRRVVGLVEWLTSLGFPTVSLATAAAQPLNLDGYPVTVWERLDASQRRPVTTGELGGLLRGLHALTPPTGLPTLEPAPGIRRSIDASAILTHDDRVLLAERLDRLASRWATMVMPLGSGLIQSDPQVRNAPRRADGTAVLADWDGASFGPRAWDVATVAVHCRRFGMDDGFHDFVTAYGWDPRTWDEFEDLCRLRELQMIATNARKSPPGSPAAREVRRRIAGLRQGDGELTAWSIL